MLSTYLKCPWIKQPLFRIVYSFRWHHAFVSGCLFCLPLFIVLPFAQGISNCSLILPGLYMHT